MSKNLDFEEIKKPDPSNVKIAVAYDLHKKKTDHLQNEISDLKNEISDLKNELAKYKNAYNESTNKLNLSISKIKEICALLNLQNSGASIILKDSE